MKNFVKQIPYLSILILSIGLMGGCEQQKPEGKEGVDVKIASTPTRAEIMNATLSGIYEKPITLNEGEYEGESFDPEGAARPRVHLITELMPSGDLNRDGVDEVLALLEENSGGSGTFLYLVPLTTVDGIVQQLGVVDVGDRVGIRSVTIEDGAIIMYTVETGPEDAACCPTQKKKRSWTLNNNVLSEMEEQVEGRISLQDLEGPEWVLSAFNPKETAPVKPEITFRLDFEKMSVSGFSGCNNYLGTVRSKDSGEISIGPLAGTKKMCPPDQMAIETRVLGALGGATGFGFYRGKPAIEYKDGEEIGMLLFTPRDVKTRD